MFNDLGKILIRILINFGGTTIRQVGDCGVMLVPDVRTQLGRIVHSQASRQRDDWTWSRDLGLKSLLPILWIRKPARLLKTAELVVRSPALHRILSFGLLRFGVEMTTETRESRETFWSTVIWPESEALILLIGTPFAIFAIASYYDGPIFGAVVGTLVFLIMAVLWPVGRILKAWADWPSKSRLVLWLKKIVHWFMFPNE